MHTHNSINPNKVECTSHFQVLCLYKFLLFDTRYPVSSILLENTPLCMYMYCDQSQIRNCLDTANTHDYLTQAASCSVDNFYTQSCLPCHCMSLACIVHKCRCSRQTPIHAHTLFHKCRGYNMQVFVQNQEPVLYHHMIRRPDTHGCGIEQYPNPWDDLLLGSVPSESVPCDRIHPST